MKRLIAALGASVLASSFLLACDATDARIASENLSKAADQFEIFRRITFLNGITDSAPLVIEGRCSIDADGADAQLEVTCKDDNGQFVKHFLGLSDNMTYVVEQLQPAEASTSRYRFIVKPSALIPEIDLQ